MFNWRKSTLARQAESCRLVDNGKHYWLVATTTIKDNEFQALANGVRVTKELFAYMADAREACERWYEREVLGLDFDPRCELDAVVYTALSDNLSSTAIVEAILDKFTIAPKR